MKLLKPSPGSITSGYGPRTGGVGSTNHKGIDFSWMRPDGVQDWNIYAAAAGTVVFAGYYGGWGYLIRIDHGRGYQTWYAHQSVFRVRNGEKVAAGRVIGVIGNTGTSAGPHLHFELRLFGVPINPTNKFTTTAGGDPIIIDLEKEDTNMRVLKNKTTNAYVRVGEFSALPLSEANAKIEATIWNVDGKILEVSDPGFVQAVADATNEGERYAQKIASLVPAGAGVTGAQLATIAADVADRLKPTIETVKAPTVAQIVTGIAGWFTRK